MRKGQKKIITQETATSFLERFVKQPQPNLNRLLRYKAMLRREART
jgi:hypothetical protein